MASTTKPRRARQPRAGLEGPEKRLLDAKLLELQLALLSTDEVCVCVFVSRWMHVMSAGASFLEKQACVVYSHMHKSSTHERAGVPSKHEDSDIYVETHHIAI